MWFGNLCRRFELTCRIRAVLLGLNATVRVDGATVRVDSATVRIYFV